MADPAIDSRESTLAPPRGSQDSREGATRHDVPIARTWYRTTLYNAFVIGGLAFTAPGLWNAMNSLGAGGAESPYLINAANALVFGLSALALGYPEPEKRGTYLNIWLWFRTSGPIVGNIIVLARNHSVSGAGKIQSQTYLIFVGLQCVSVPIAFLLTPPEKVQRSDGSPVRVIREQSWKAEMQALWRTSTRPEVLLLLPVFWASFFNQYISNFEVYYFGVRGRALAGLCLQFANLFSSLLISQFLDLKLMTVKRRMIYRQAGPASFFYVVRIHVVAWVYAWVVQEQFTAMATSPVYDWADRGYVKALFVLILWRTYSRGTAQPCTHLPRAETENAGGKGEGERGGAGQGTACAANTSAEWSQQAFQNWLYYLVSTMADNISELSRLTGVLRGQESSYTGWRERAKEKEGQEEEKSKPSHMFQADLSCSPITGLAVLPSWLVIQRHNPVKYSKDEAMEGQEPVDEEQAPATASEKDLESARKEGGSPARRG
ncbi:hypothetical protein KEM52_000184 [Ascosphaera acerosa]|nr:hypothetical protein KEM52_000184 [Ascosphaera acerosa]